MLPESELLLDGVLARTLNPDTAVMFPLLTMSFSAPMPPAVWMLPEVLGPMSSKVEFQP